MKVYLCSTVGTTVNLILQQLAIPQHGVYLQFNHTSQSQKKELPNKEELLTSRFNCMQMSDACTPFLSFPETFQKHTHAIISQKPEPSLCPTNRQRAREKMLFKQRSLTHSTFQSQRVSFGLLYNFFWRCRLPSGSCCIVLHDEFHQLQKFPFSSPVPLFELKPNAGSGLVIMFRLYYYLTFTVSELERYE